MENLKKKILVVEDEEEVRKVIIDLLENAGYTISFATDGLEAVEILEQEIPELVLSDIMMPNMDGYKLLEHFRAMPGTEETPFIFLTARIENRDIKKGLSKGADDYMTKPFRVKDLLAIVEIRLKLKRKQEL